MRPVYLLLVGLTTGIALSVPIGTPALAQSSSGGTTTMWSFLAEGNFEPMIEGSYGYGIIDHKSFSADLPVAGVAGVKLGFREAKLFKSWGKKLDERFFLGGIGNSASPPGKPGTGDLAGEWWRIGLGQRAGYGWQLGRQALIPYHQYSFNYGEMTFKNTASLSPADTALISRVMGAGRLSMSTEAGLTVNLFSTVSASAGYEASVIYSRLIFPQWITSYLLLGSSVAVMSKFAEEIVSSSPLFGPILYFILRNGVAYGFFYAFRSQMNWPFTSEAPFMTHTFKIDLSVEF
jgi:hypothetical protein